MKALLLVLLLFTACSSPEYVVVPESMQTCTVDDDCTFAETACNGCCQYVGINKEHRDQYYDEFFVPACEHYSGGVCDCAPVSTATACENGRCLMVPE